MTYSPRSTDRVEPSAPDEAPDECFREMPQPVNLPMELNSSRLGSISSQRSNNLPQLFPSVEARTEWPSLWIACSLCLITVIQFTLFLSSQWPFLKVLDPTVTEFFYGSVVASNALAPIFFGPLVGWWSNRIRQLRLPLLSCVLFQIAGNVIYASLELFPEGHRIWWMLVARFVAGIGMSNIGLLKAYAAMASTPADRRRAVALVSGSFALGVTIGPALQALFGGIGYPGWRLELPWLPGLTISMYTAPAWFSNILNVATAVILMWFFRESYVGVLKKPEAPGKEKKGEEKLKSETVKLPSYDRVAVAACCAIRFTTIFVFTNIETYVLTLEHCIGRSKRLFFSLGSSFEMMMFSFTASEMINYCECGA